MPMADGYRLGLLVIKVMLVKLCSCGGGVRDVDDDCNNNIDFENEDLQQQKLKDVNENKQCCWRIWSKRKDVGSSKNQSPTPPNVFEGPMTILSDVSFNTSMSTEDAFW
ncbi:Protein of unknown function [Gryllus bimaculatus]|nr:Protein of unknown function [Gryllus bimaculatus]